MSESQDESSSDNKKSKFNNTIPLWGNESTMNLNALILTNIQSSTYFKVSLFKLKTYHEVIDEIYYQVKHMEPWEKGSRKTSGQSGMCGGVRGVGAGGIVSSAYCLLYKLYTLRLTRKQLNGLLTHSDSPYIRALGFMYLRYTQPPADLYDWYEQYLQDEEEIDVKAGGGHKMTIGQMLVQWLTKLDWFSTLFPRIPVPIQKQIQYKLDEYAREYGTTLEEMTGQEVGAGNNNNKHRMRQQDFGGHEGGAGGRPTNYERSQQGGDSYRGGGGGGGRVGSSGGESRNNNYNRYADERAPSSSVAYRQRSRSRSRSPARSKHYEKEGSSSRGHHNKRRSSPAADEFEDHQYERRAGRDRERDDYYYQRDRDSYKASSSSHRRHY